MIGESMKNMVFISLMLLTAPAFGTPYLMCNNSLGINSA